MENLNINDLIAELEGLEIQDALTSEERISRISEIEGKIKSISIVLHKLFEIKAQLEEEEAQYQKELELLNEKFNVLQDIYAPKK